MVFLHELFTSLPSSRGWAIWPSLSYSNIHEFKLFLRLKWIHRDSPTILGIKRDADRCKKEKEVQRTNLHVVF